MAEKTIAGFLSTLEKNEVPVFDYALRQIQDECRPERLERVAQRLNELKIEINRTNKRREMLGKKLTAVYCALELVDKFIAENGGSIEMEMLRSVLNGIVWDFRKEIGVLKPDRRLIQKSDISRVMDNLLQRREIVNYLSILTRKEKDDQKQVVAI